MSTSDTGGVIINKPAHMLLVNVVSRENVSNHKYLVIKPIKDSIKEILLE